MIELLGYFCTACTLLGFFLNARKNIYGFLSWIIGDIGWVLYAILTGTYPHAIQCVVIIMLNVYGWWNWKKENDLEIDK